MEALTAYGRHIGLTFQIVDDILDVTQSSQHLGKTAGKDAKVKKATYPALYGIDASREKARSLAAAAISSVDGLGPGAEPLRALARFICSRTA